MTKMYNIQATFELPELDTPSLFLLKIKAFFLYTTSVINRFNEIDVSIGNYWFRVCQGVSEQSQFDLASDVDGATFFLS